MTDRGCWQSVAGATKQIHVISNINRPRATIIAMPPTVTTKSTRSSEARLGQAWVWPTMPGTKDNRRNDKRVLSLWQQAAIRQTERKTDRQRGRQTDRQSHRQTDRQRGRQIDKPGEERKARRCSPPQTKNGQPKSRHAVVPALAS